MERDKFQTWYCYDDLDRMVMWYDDKGNVTQFFYANLMNRNLVTHMHQPKSGRTFRYVYNTKNLAPKINFDVFLDSSTTIDQISLLLRPRTKDSMLQLTKMAHHSRTLMLMLMLSNKSDVHHLVKSSKIQIQNFTFQLASMVVLWIQTPTLST